MCMFFGLGGLRVSRFCPADFVECPPRFSTPPHTVSVAPPCQTIRGNNTCICPTQATAAGPRRVAEALPCGGAGCQGCLSRRRRCWPPQRDVPVDEQTCWLPHTHMATDHHCWRRPHRALFQAATWSCTWSCTSCTWSCRKKSIQLWHETMKPLPKCRTTAVVRPRRGAPFPALCRNATTQHIALPSCSRAGQRHMGTPLRGALLPCGRTQGGSLP